MLHFPDPSLASGCSSVKRTSLPASSASLCSPSSSYTCLPQSHTRRRTSATLCGAGARVGEVVSAFCTPSSSRGTGKGFRTCTYLADRVVPRALAQVEGDRQTQPNVGQPDAPGSAADTERIGVLLLNLGGPEKLEDVQPFLYNLFADPDILRLPALLTWVQPLVATVISVLRAPKSSEGYRAIGGGSPLRRITDDQASALAASMRAKGVPAYVFVAMRYWHPYTEEALEEIKRVGVTKLVVLPLYPQFSISTSGSSLRLLEQMFKEDAALQNLKHTVIPSWYQRKGYVGAMVDLITASLKKFRRPESVEVFFSAHGVPKSYVVEAGDPYKEEMEECVDLIVRELAARGWDNHHTLAYQSRVGPVEWLQPYTDDALRRLGAAGQKSLLAVPISFVSEHIETLEEIDMEYRELAHECGISHWERVPALNTDANFIDDLADAVIEALPYVGCVAKPSNALVPMGEVESLLEAYDRDRLALPSPVEIWRWGWTRSAETWNGRIAMVAIVVIVLLESLSGRSFLYDLLDLSTGMA